jgi:hypothetical protein
MWSAKNAEAVVEPVAQLGGGVEQHRRAQRLRAAQLLPVLRKGQW